VAATNQHPAIDLGDVCRQFGDESGLANASLTDDEDHLARPGDCLSECHSQLCHLLVAPDKGSVCGQSEGRHACDGWRAS
jgi:hypothetical protein